MEGAAWARPGWVLAAWKEVIPVHPGRNYHDNDWIYRCTLLYLQRYIVSPCILGQNSIVSVRFARFGIL
jgi:hypothetical protein